MKTILKKSFHWFPGLIGLFLISVLLSCKKQDIDYPDKQNTSYKPSKQFDHIQHIRKYSRKRPPGTNELYPEYFVDYVIEHCLESKKYKKFITDRKLLRKLKNKTCWDNYLMIKDSLLNGDNIKIELKIDKFDSLNRVLKYQNSSNFLIEVDGKHPYGSVYAVQPEREIKSLKIVINDNEIETSVDKYQNLYEPKLCNFGSHQKITEAYEDGEHIYIYIFGGNAADAYFAKLIFHKKSGYITSIISDYKPLSRYGSFGEHFIGY